MTETVIMNLDQVAKYLSVAPATIKRICRQGTGPRFMRISRNLTFRKQDVDEWVAQQTQAEPKAKRRTATKPVEKARVRVQASRG